MATTTLDAWLFPDTGSAVEARTRAVLEIVAPSATVVFTRATIVTVADLSAPSDEKVTLRLAPLPPQAPPAVAEQETNASVGGKVSLRVIDRAVAGPWLVSRAVYETFDPVRTVSGLELRASARSAAGGREIPAVSDPLGRRVAWSPRSGGGPEATAAAAADQDAKASTVKRTSEFPRAESDRRSATAHVPLVFRPWGGRWTNYRPF
jgi:hypothetical protein